jgi:hypothetical protein
MAKNETKRISPKVLRADRDALAAIQVMSDYSPPDKRCTLDKLAAQRAVVEVAQAAEVQQRAEADAARDHACAAEWAFHNLMLDAKTQVRAQYGEDSNQLQALGLKKKSERAKAGPKQPVAKPV